ncbi:MAG: hypothetical protein IJ523_02280 [Succinivibrionaceae bacterium]|nr:hypothetical protein [Succinivibrionaceae bacterium]
MSDNLNKEAVIGLLNRLIDETRNFEDGDRESEGLLVLNDFALLNLIKKEIQKLRADYEGLTRLKEQFTREIEKIGTELVRNAENRAEDVRKRMNQQEEKLFDQLESDIYRAFRRHFNANLREQLLEQPERIKSGEFDDVIARVILATSDNAVVAGLNKRGEEIEKENRELKRELKELKTQYDEMSEKLDRLMEREEPEEEEGFGFFGKSRNDKKKNDRSRSDGKKRNAGKDDSQERGGGRAGSEDTAGNAKLKQDAGKGDDAVADQASHDAEETGNATDDSGQSGDDTAEAESFEGQTDTGVEDGNGGADDEDGGERNETKEHKPLSLKRQGGGRGEGRGEKKTASGIRKRAAKGRRK